jgi:hypothetical protein
LWHLKKKKTGQKDLFFGDRNFQAGKVHAALTGGAAAARVVPAPGGTRVCFRFRFLRLQ